MPERRPTVLQLCRSANAAEIRQRNRGLSVEPPIENPDEGFHDVEDDAAAAGRANAQPEPRPCRPSTMVSGMELRGRLPPSTRLAIGWPFVVHVAEGKIGELVVEQEACRPDARAEGAFDRGRERDGVAVSVDDREVAGAVRRSTVASMPNARCSEAERARRLAAGAITSAGRSGRGDDAR